MVNKEAELVWYNGMVEELGLVGLGNIEEKDGGFDVSYDPSKLTAHQAQELMSIAQRDGFFSETYLDVKDNVIKFRKDFV